MARRDSASAVKNCGTLRATLVARKTERHFRKWRPPRRCWRAKIDRRNAPIVRNKRRRRGHASIFRVERRRSRDAAPRKKAFLFRSFFGSRPTGAPTHWRRFECTRRRYKPGPPQQTHRSASRQSTLERLHALKFTYQTIVVCFLPEECVRQC